MLSPGNPVLMQRVVMPPYGRVKCLKQRKHPIMDLKFFVERYVLWIFSSDMAQDFAKF